MYSLEAEIHFEQRNAEAVEAVYDDTNSLRLGSDANPMQVAIISGSSTDAIKSFTASSECRGKMRLLVHDYRTAARDFATALKHCTDAASERQFSFIQLLALSSFLQSTGQSSSDKELLAPYVKDPRIQSIEQVAALYQQDYCELFLSAARQNCADLDPFIKELIEQVSLQQESSVAKLFLAVGQ